jgi:predicted amidophosphoribosyltransferase
MYQILQAMKNDQKSKLCCRCNRHATNDVICQSCKNELLNHYEASLDWQTAFEIERAQMVAARYRQDDEDSIDSSHFMF